MKSHDAPQEVPALVECEWLREHLDKQDIYLIEINRVSLDHYDTGHIPGAVGWNWKSALWDPNMREFPSPQEFANRLSQAGILPTTRIVVYGEPVQFGVYAWWALRYCGHENTVLLNGGHRAWEARGYELTTDRPARRAEVDYPLQMRRGVMRASRNHVLEIIGDSDSCIIDARSPEEYAGQALGSPDANHGAERFGRIPGAVHAYFEEFLDSEERFREPSEIRARLATIGATSDKSHIAYCRLSHRASVAYFAMTQLLGYPDVRLYDGSWTEWGSMVGMPIEVPSD